MRKTVSVAVLFADIARSTQLYDILGDKRAQIQITDWLKILSEVTVRHRGLVIKTIGDEVLCTFRNVQHAVAAGKEMHQALDRMPVQDAPEVGSPNIYIGIHWGQVIVEEGDIFGDVVNVAARLVTLAKQRQILLSEDAMLNLSSDEQNHTKFIDMEVVKGKFEEVRYFEYIWEQLDLTMIVDKNLDKKAMMYSLELRTKTHITLVDQTHPVVTFGRQGHNDFILKNKRVSRTHARIEYRWGKFVLIDQSSNGTYVIDQKDKKRFLKRGETVLPPSGFLNFGDETGENSSDTVRFTRK
ncbi:MAG: adenylate/guanylate cyclase domain-containing protein [Proteobacteria bacterium]|nr:adenylate/guanylate cyclase domain-containing protein [Pseudomonadota bacterium]